MFDQLQQRLDAVKQAGRAISGDFDGAITDLQPTCLFVDFGIRAGLCRSRLDRKTND